MQLRGFATPLHAVPPKLIADAPQALACSAPRNSLCRSQHKDGQRMKARIRLLQIMSKVSDIAAVGQP